MRNERWWTSYVDRALYEYDDFDRFLHNLDQIELEQTKHQEQLQSQQLRAHRRSASIQIVSKDNLNAASASPMAKKPTGLNKIRNMLSSGGSHSNGSDRHGACHGQQEQIRVRHYDETTKPNRLLKQRESDAPSKSSSVSCKKYVLMMAYKLRDMSDVRKSTHVRKIFFLKIQPINKKEYVVSAQNFFQFFSIILWNTIWKLKIVYQLTEIYKIVWFLRLKNYRKI